MLPACRRARLCIAILAKRAAWLFSAGRALPILSTREIYHAGSSDRSARDVAGVFRRRDQPSGIPSANPSALPHFLQPLPTGTRSPHSPQLDRRFQARKAVSCEAEPNAPCL